MRSKFLKQDVSNNMHFLVDPLRDLYGFSNAHTLMFFVTSEKGGSNQEKGSKLRSHGRPAWKCQSPGPPKGAHSDREGGRNGGHSEF